jgi:phosphatidylglycerophosphate synthase
MSRTRGQLAILWASLALGVVLFIGALYYISFPSALAMGRQLGVALPLAVLLGGLWHLARTWAWARCFPQPRQVSFLRLARVRLYAEAFSYLTLRGIVGEPLKVVLLADSIDPREVTAALALERIAYLVGTTVIVGAASLLAIVLVPMTSGWLYVFIAFAIAGCTIGALSARVIAGRGIYVQGLLRRLDRAGDTSFSESVVGRFLTAVECQTLELVRGDPRRLAVLATATLFAFGCMVLEAWVILAAWGAPITGTGALAVESFSRVTSFATAFIPANLGALEASSLAAVTAVGAIAGGAALALGRRLRGLFWAAIGLAIYPRRRAVAAVNDPAVRGVAQQRPPTLIYFPQDDGVTVLATARLAGLPIAERVLRAAARAGYTRIVVWAPDTGDCAQAAPSTTLRASLHRLAPSIGADIRVAVTESEWQSAIAHLGASDPLTAIGAGTVVSPALLEAARSIVPAAGQVLDVPAGPAWPESGVLRLQAADAVDRGRLGGELRMRRRRALSRPSGEDVSHGRAQLALQVTNHDELAAAELTIRRSIYKSTDAKLARLNRRMSVPISLLLIRTPITANQISVILVALGLYSGWLFSLGHYWTGVLGGVLSLAGSILDGSDGEIARLKYQESALGCWIETCGDYSYYIATFIGLTAGAVRQTGWDLFYWLGTIALTGMVLSFVLLIWLRSRITGGKPEKLHAIARVRFKAHPTWWSRVIWRISFVATRAAMPYGILALALVFALPGVVVLAAVGANVYWISLVLKLQHLLNEPQAAVALRHPQPATHLE